VRIAVVGNGPSAKGQGDLIDACDLVVRTGQFAKVFKDGSAGNKLSVLAWPGYRKMNKLLPKRKCEWWITCPVKWHKGPARLANVNRLSKRATKVRWIPLHDYMAIRHRVQNLSDWAKEFPPSTGILAVHMAVTLHPDSMLVCGFDAGKAYADGRWYSKTLHDYFAERKALEDLERGRWLGEHHDIDVDWRKL
jgi:hypothetical protein